MRLELLKYSVTVLIAAFMMLAPVSSVASPKKPNFDKMFYGDLNRVISFGNVIVGLEGSAEKIGLSRSFLNDFLKLQIKNSFNGIKLKNIKMFSTVNGKYQQNKNPHIGRVYVKVWTIGDDFPIAYHVSLTAGTYEKYRIYTDAVLGYGSKKNVPDSIKGSISKMIDRFAISFFKARDEL